MMIAQLPQNAKMSKCTCVFSHILDIFREAEFSLIILSENKISSGISEISGKSLKAYWELPERHDDYRASMEAC